MASENAKNVAREILETIRQGKKVNKGEILRNNGYSEATSTVPSLVTETQSYKDVVEPIAKRWEKEIARIQSALEGRNLGEEKYKDLVDSLDKLNKNHQLLTGGDTERLTITGNVVVFKDFKDGKGD